MATKYLLKTENCVNPELTGQAFNYLIDELMKKNVPFMTSFSDGIYRLTIVGNP